MTDKTMVALDPDERAFVEALNRGDEAAMISIFAAVNGTRTLDSAEYIASKKSLSDEPAASAPTPESPDTSEVLPAEKSAPAENQPKMPMSWQQRQRFRNRKISPDVRFQMLGMLEEIRDLVNDNACRIARERYGGDKAGIFEEDQIADQIIIALADYLGTYPNVGQLASEYHTNWFYDLEYDYSRKTYTAYAADGRTVQAQDVRGEPDEWDPKQMEAAKQDAESQEKDDE